MDDVSSYLAKLQQPILKYGLEEIDRIIYALSDVANLLDEVEPKNKTEMKQCRQLASLARERLSECIKSDHISKWQSSVVEEYEEDFKHIEQRFLSKTATNKRPTEQPNYQVPGKKSKQTTTDADNSRGSRPDM